MFLEVLAAVILTESITNVLSKSDLFESVRKFLFDHRGKRLFKFAHTVIDCPYCLSVWVGVFCACLLYLYINNCLPIIFIWIGVGIILHRLSNVLHFIIDRLDLNHNDLDKVN